MTTPLLRSQRQPLKLADRTHRPTSRRPRRRLTLETLEGRLLLAANLRFNDYADVAGLDTAGNLYVYGEIQRTYDEVGPQLGTAADLDPGPDSQWLAGPTTYLAKYTPEKALLWARRTDELFSAADAKIIDVAIASANGQDFVYVMWGEIASGTRTITRLQDTGAGLTPLWHTAVGTHGWITVGGDGSVYMSNMFNGTVDFDPSDPADPTPGTGDTIATDGQDASLAKWDVNGAFQWVRQLGGTQTEWMYDLAVVNDGTGDTIYVGGSFNSSFTPQGYTGPTLTDQGSTTNSGDQDGYLVGYDSDGTFVSVGQFVDARVQQVSGDASGTYIAGTHYYAALGLPGTQNEDIYFGKLDASGQALAWVKGLPGPGSNSVGDLLVDGGSLVLTGLSHSPFGGTMDFDPDAGTYDLTPAGGADAYVASYGAASGALQWARLMGSGTKYNVWLAEAGTSLAVSGTELYVGGFFGPGQATMGTDTLTNTAEADGFVTRMSRADGSHRWAFSVGSLVRTIDDGDAGYSESGSGWKNNTNGGFGSDSRYHMKGNGSNKAQWVFTGLPAGNYEVLATWKASSKNATNAAYSVNGTTVTRNQRVAPDDYVSDGNSWKSLGAFAPGGDGKLTVTLSDLANGNVVADAVRIVFKGPATLQAAAASTAVSAETPIPKLGQSRTAGGRTMAPDISAFAWLADGPTLRDLATDRIVAMRKGRTRAR